MVVVYSGIGITNAKGRLGGTVLSGNAAGRMGSIYRKPITRFNPTQCPQRNVFQTVIAGWQNLSDSQRSGWNTEAATGDWDWTNSLGETIQPSGFQLYTQVNLRLATIGTSLSTAASKPTLSPPSLTTSTPIVNTSFNLGFSPGTINSNEWVIIEATTNLSAGTFSPRHSEYKFITRVPSGSFGAAVNIFSPWSGIYGKIVAGCSIFVRATLLDEDSGDEATCGTLRAIATE